MDNYAEILEKEKKLDNKESLLEEIRELYLGGASGSIIGRNSFQRPYTDALALLNQIMDIYKGK